MAVIGKGAEAVISLEKGIVIKKRPKKTYRIPEIDEKLRKFRTRRETKVLQKLSEAGIPAPKLLSSDEHNIKMQHIKGRKLRDILDTKNCKELCLEIGQKTAQMHNLGIIHGDLTTSNMILAEEIYFIDFGLSFFSQKTEDKAVDLHLLRQALESKHSEIFSTAFDNVLRGYRKSSNYSQIVKRLEAVEERGRNKQKL